MIEVPNLEEKTLPVFQLKCSKFEQDPWNINDFMAQNVTFCLPECKFGLFRELNV